MLPRLFPFCGRIAQVAGEEVETSDTFIKFKSFSTSSLQNVDDVLTSNEV